MAIERILAIPLTVVNYNTPITNGNISQKIQFCWNMTDNKKRPSAVYELTARGPKLPRAQGDDTQRKRKGQTGLEYEPLTCPMAIGPL
jgi:hypothetical protein